jgi:hypothetical protein
MTTMTNTETKVLSGAELDNVAGGFNPGVYAWQAAILKTNLHQHNVINSIKGGVSIVKNFPGFFD